MEGAMNIDVQARGFALTQAIQAAIRRETAQLADVDGAHRLQVRLFDVNGTRGGIDKGCLVTLHLSRERRVIVATELDSDLYRAIPSAFDKLRRALGSAVRRTRSLRRRVASASPRPDTA
jgi:ribosome-associated translation inhibitor RaiA